MNKLNGRELKVLFVLSIVVPVGLLVTLRLGGILHEPSQPEMFIAEVVKWNFERQGLTCRIDQVVENSYNNEDVSAVFQITLQKHSTDFGPPFGGVVDVTNMRISTKAVVFEGSVEGIYVVFRGDYKSSYVNILPGSYSAAYETLNVSVKRRVDYITNWWELENDTKGFISAVGVNQPSEVSFGFPAYWILKDDGNETSGMEVALELTYRTKNSYGKVILSTQLKLFNDQNNSLGTATLVESGTTYSGLWIGGYDVSDYNRIHLSEGNILEVNATDVSFTGSDWTSPYFEVRLYDPLGSKRTSTEPGYSHFLTYPIDSTGEWFIEVHIIEVGGFYSLKIDVGAD